MNKKLDKHLPIYIGYQHINTPKLVVVNGVAGAPLQGGNPVGVQRTGQNRGTVAL
jgi:hypothetical protein